MRNLHREIAPVSDAAWAEIDAEARRTFARWVAGRRVVDVVGPAGPELAAVGTGHRLPLDDASDGTHDAAFTGVQAHRREARHVVELRVPFEVTRDAVDDVERGAQDSDWEPVKQAVTRLALAEDRAVFHGSQAAGIDGIVPSSSNAAVPLPDDTRALPEAVAQALGALRLAGVEGPYRLLLSADAYTAASETSDHGYPVLHHVRNLLDGDAIWAPALDGALLVSTRGGDYALHLGQDASIGYDSHDGDVVRLYVQESLTFLVATAEASVALPHG